MKDTYPNISNSDNNASGAPLATLDDAHLIASCLDGNERAWEILIKRYSQLIYTVPLRFGLSNIVADEIFQETCLILLEKLDTLRDRNRLSAWLLTVSRRACIQRWRQRDRDESNGLLYMETTDEGRLEDEILRIERQHLVRYAIRNLNSRCQQLLNALFLENPPLPYEVVANRLDIPVGSIGPTRGRCLEKLRQEIVKLEGVQE